MRYLDPQWIAQAVVWVAAGATAGALLRPLFTRSNSRRGGR